MADVYGDWREEIIVLVDNKVIIFENTALNPHPNQSRLWNNRNYHRLKQNHNYYSLKIDRFPKLKKRIQVIDN